MMLTTVGPHQKDMNWSNGVWTTTSHPTNECKWHSSSGLPHSGGIVGKRHIGEVIGKVNIRTPLFHVDRGYECAAWWLKTETATGIFDVRLTKGYHSPHELLAVVTVPATKIDGYFAGLYCGVPISREPYVFAEKGQQTEIGLIASLSKACVISGSKGGDVETLIDLPFWDVAELYEEMKVQHEAEAVSAAWESYQAGPEKYRDLDSKLSSLAHNGKWLYEHAELLRELRRGKKRWQGSYYDRLWKFSETAA